MIQVIKDFQIAGVRFGLALDWEHRWEEKLTTDSPDHYFARLLELKNRRYACRNELHELLPQLVEHLQDRGLHEAATAVARAVTAAWHHKHRWHEAWFEATSQLRLAALPQPEQAAQVPDTQLPSKPEQPQPKRYRRKPEVPAEKTAEEIAFGFLLLWHKYGTENFNTDPIPPLTKFVLWVTEKNAGKPGPSEATFSLMFKHKFGNHKKYLTACGNGTLENKLALGNGEAARVYQQQRQRERTTTDPEQDLD